MVVDSGDGVTHAVPVWDGFVNQTLISRLDVAGRHVTRYLLEFTGRSMELARLVK